jgi:hypothetical protein
MLIVRLVRPAWRKGLVVCERASAAAADHRKRAGGSGDGCGVEQSPARPDSQVTDHGVLAQAANVRDRFQVSDPTLERHHRLRTYLHAPQTHQHLNRVARPARRHQEVDEGTWIVSFRHYGLGFIDLEQKTCNLSTTRCARGRYRCLRYGL